MGAGFPICARIVLGWVLLAGQAVIPAPNQAQSAAVFSRFQLPGISRLCDEQPFSAGPTMKTIEEIKASFAALQSA